MATPAPTPMEAEQAPVHRYGTEIGEEDPRCPQPERIRLPLKPHQSAAVAKAVALERDAIFYNIPPAPAGVPQVYSYQVPVRGNVRFKSNVAILGDAPSYGKTLIALSVIAQNPSNEIDMDAHRIKTSWFPGRSAYAMVTTDRAQDIPDDTADFFNTTLVIVPRGPVYVQWKNQIEKNTTLRMLAIDGAATLRKQCPPQTASAADLKAFFEQYDIVIIKNTTLKEMISHYAPRYELAPHPLRAWNRIMVDEAHDIIHTLPTIFQYKFIWLITATFETLPRMLYSARGPLTGSLRDIITPAWLSLLTVRGARDFVVKSFHIPPIIENNYICELPRTLAAVQKFLSPQILDRINAGDVAGAIQMLGGSTNSEDGIVELVTRDIQRDIANKEREAQYLNAIDIPPIQRAARMQTLNTELERLRTRLASLTERVTHLTEKCCDICGDPFENPVFLKCTHVTCAQCLMQWLQSSAGGGTTIKTCPTCRAPIDMKSLVAIVNPATAAAAASTSTANVPASQLPKSKEQAIIDIIRSKPDGRFLIFSRVDASLYNIMHRLYAEGIQCCELKGNTAQMMSKLRSFQENETRVILLNTRFAGSGIDITCATDVILVHSMGEDATQAVGRANRVGRTTPLHVHKLLYPHEAQNI